jgi:2-keto-3-deoxy-L-rhamnonate aldolase RhmA
MESLKTRIANRELTIGSWITLGYPAIAEIMTRSGFDWLTVDLEHSSITIAQTEELIRVIELAGIPPLVRVGENNPATIKRVMDAGAHGVIVPMVNTREDAELALRSVQYPPRGTRGVGLARAQRYGLDIEAYRKWNEANSVVIVQIEHVRAIENLESIFATGVDAFMVGPYDLSASMGIPGQFEHEHFQEALQQIRKVALKTSKPAGYHFVKPDPEGAVEKIREGYLLLAYSTDFLFLAETSRNHLGTIKQSLK